MANEVRVLLFAAVVSAGHPAGSAVAVDESAPLARHAATFTTFCDTGSVSDGSCWCKGGSATAAIGDGSWLWHELVGKECPAQPNDRCDCSAGGGASDDCPHQGNWQCQGINAPQCNADDSLKRCEVTVHGSHGAEKYYITEVCPGQHPCNRCKSAELQRCAAWSPLAVDLCGTTWHLIFEASRSEATGYVTLSCYPNEYAGSDSHPGEAVEPEEEEAATSDRSCYSNMPDDTPDATCENWCDPNWATDHCRYCKCRGCDALAGKCEAIRGELEAQERHRAELFTSCGRRLDCLSWVPTQYLEPWICLMTAVLTCPVFEPP